ncbi:MAG: HPr family phosphocarrier protein, partial [Thermoguttaceae bacterium]|nr:HPr family phosphocarrier protein [Thermoguttaceae bacterium]
MQITKELTLINKEGFHVRPASLVCAIVSKSKSEASLKKGGYEADCKSCLDLMALVGEKGDVLTLSVTGEDAETVAAAIEDLFNRKFEEEE